MSVGAGTVTGGKTFYDMSFTKDQTVSEVGSRIVGEQATTAIESIE
jgi:hypothetical protein